MATASPSKTANNELMAKPKEQSKAPQTALKKQSENKNNFMISPVSCMRPARAGFG